MRTLSANAASRRKRGAPPNRIPREGTRLREIWDLLQANRGVVVTLNLTKDSAAIEQLRSFYGLDLRRILHNKHWCLCGEWIDGKYIDYVKGKWT
jgi:hypothetical protein